MEVMIAKGDGCDFSQGVDGFELITTKEVGSGRWTTSYTAVLKHLETGKMYGYDYKRGNTECQENEYPDGKIELREMKSEQVTTEVWSYVN